MHVVTLENETDFAGWRQAARTLVMNHVEPADIIWRIKGGEHDLLEDLSAPALPEPVEGTFNVPAKSVSFSSVTTCIKSQIRAVLPSA